MLTTAAFNSLLKTLEEPPRSRGLRPRDDRPATSVADDYFPLSAVRLSPDSRCGYGRTSDLYCQARTDKHRPRSRNPHRPNRARSGLRDAESLLDRLSLLDGEITPDRVSDAIGSVPERDLLEILQAIVKSDPESLLDRTRKILERGKEPLIVLQNLAGCYRDLAIAKAAPQRADLVALTPETWAELIKIAQTWQLDRILAAQTHLKDSEIQLKQTTQPQLWLEIAIFGLLTPNTQSAPTIAHLPLPPAVTPPVTPPPQSQPASLAPPHQISPNITPPPVAAVASQTAIDSNDLASTWERVLQQLLPASRDLFKPFGKLISIAETQAIVAMKSSTMQTIASGKVPELAKVFSNMYGRAIAVKLEVLGKSQPQPSALPPSPPSVPAATIAVDPPPTPTFVPDPAEYLTIEEEDDLRDESPVQSKPSIDPPSAPAPIAPPTPVPSVSADLFEPAPPADFAEPPASIDVERAIHPPLPPEELEIDPLLQMATANLVTTFHGEVIDRTHDLFDKIVGN